MEREDYIGLAICVGFGLWWVLLPNSVIKFYTWFHGGRVPLPKQFVIRPAGGLWIALVLAVTMFALK